MISEYHSVEYQKNLTDKEEEEQCQSGNTVGLDIVSCQNKKDLNLYVEHEESGEFPVPGMEDLSRIVPFPEQKVGRNNYRDGQELHKLHKGLRVGLQKYKSDVGCQKPGKGYKKKIQSVVEE